ncbi:MAG: flagellar basal-body MS-ring/collar protein FliF [Pseudomonadota bacterium]
MDQLLAIWTRLDARRRVVALLALVAVVAVVVGIGRMAFAPQMSLLYSGLDATAAGDVVAALEQNGTVYEVRGNAIYVSADARDRVRLTLASQNLPANGASGYELLDALSGFGTTSEMFDATYWRAKEGELARTILASPNVRAARVHIANPVRRPFERRTEASASVIVTMSAGSLGTTQAQAIRYLVASAVANLAPENVSVLDAAAGVVLRSGEGGNSPAAPGQTADTMSEALRGKLERLLAARVGAGRAIVEVTVETEMESETITERVIDPDSRVEIASDTEEMTETEQGSNPGAVTVASNLPDGEEGAGGGSRSRNRAETRARSNFEVSEVLRERVRVPGEIRRISAAILVDGTMETGADGTVTWTPRSEEELAALEQLVRSAIGFDETRGDTVTIESLQFAATAVPGTLAESAGLGDFLARNAMTLIQITILALVALGLGLFVLRPLARASRVRMPELEVMPALNAADEDEDTDERIFESINMSGNMSGNMGADLPSDRKGEIAGEVVAAPPPPPGRLGELRDTIALRADDSTALLKSWLEAPRPAEDPA